MAAEYVKQHIVPQVYLCRFAEKKKKGYHIGVRYENSGKILLSQSSVRNIGFQNHIYDDKRRDDRKHWEHELAKLYDPLYGRRLDEIIAKITMIVDGFIVSEEDKALICKLIIVQFVRVPTFLNSLVEGGKDEGRKLSKSIRQIMGAELTAPKRRILDMFCQSPVGIRSLVLNTSFNEAKIDSFLRVLSKNAMCVIYNRTKMPFFTSDNPVIFYNISNQSFGLGDGGIARNDTVVLYPITPTILILIIPRAMLLDKYDEVNRRRFVLNDSDCSFVLQANMLQVYHATNQVFFPPYYLQFLKDTHLQQDE